MLRFVGHRLGAGVFVAIVVALVAAGSAQASTITVTNGNDSGPGSLRAAVAAANPGDTITIPALTVSLTSGQIAINQSLTITGAGARRTTITGTNQSRVFTVTAGTVSISGVTVTGGNGFDTPGGTAGSGGGISESGGTLTLTDSTVTGNKVTGGEGAGIQANGNLSIIRSTVSFNDASTADRAGGIGFAGAGAFELTNSTVAHNTLGPGGLGAAIYVNSAGSVTFTNDTLDLDPAGASGTVLDLNYENKPTTIANTIVLGGSSGSCSRMPTTNPSAGGNLEDQTTCNFTTATDHSSADPKLGPLQNNGGPTDTQLPPLGSLAVNAGVDGSCPATDQRGVPRPQGPHCDIGSVERTTPTTTTPNVSNVTPTGASLSASVNPVFIGGTYVYNFGTSTAYGHSTSPAQLQSGVGSQPASAALGGLAPSTTYHVQLVVTTPDGTATSSDVSFTTAAPPAATPQVSGLSASPATFSLSGRKVRGHCALATRANRHRTRCRRPVRVGVSFDLNRAGTVTFTFTRRAPGRLVKGRCVKPTRKNRGRPKCTQVIGVPGQLTMTAQAGHNTFTFVGLVGGRLLGPGSYQLTATTPGGTPVKVAFTLLP